MSSDTAKENASVVDSSVTEWKHDMGNLNDPESSSCKENENGCLSGARAWVQSFAPPVDSSVKNDFNLYGTRYFIIKSLNHENIQLSIERGIWATQVMNEPILDEAFHNSSRVILIFSVNMSGFFQGYAQMMSSVGWRRDNVWSQASRGSNPWGRSFKVKWLRLYDLPFQKTLHLKNPLNDNKPVKISRDCQELTEDIGEALCYLLDGNIDTDNRLKRNDASCNDLPSKRPCVELSCSLAEDDFDLPLRHMTWAKTPVLYSSLLYQHQAEASRFSYGCPRPPGTLLPGNLSIPSVALKISQMKSPHIKGGLTNIQVVQDMASASDAWCSSAERSPLSTLTEDDFLEMSYEEYLKVCSRCNKQACPYVNGKSHNSRQRSGADECEDDS